MHGTYGGPSFKRAPSPSAKVTGAKKPQPPPKKGGSVKTKPATKGKTR